MRTEHRCTVHGVTGTFDGMCVGYWSDVQDRVHPLDCEWQDVYVIPVDNRLPRVVMKRGVGQLSGTSVLVFAEADDGTHLLLPLMVEDTDERL